MSIASPLLPRATREKHQPLKPEEDGIHKQETKMVKYRRRSTMGVRSRLGNF